MQSISDIVSKLQNYESPDYVLQNPGCNQGGGSLYPPGGGFGCHPGSYEPGNWQKHHDVNQLDKAEQLAQDAFQKVSDPNASLQDKLEGQKEMTEAEDIRKQVEGDLNPHQRQKLEQINDQEQQAFTDAATSDNSLLGTISRAIDGFEMNDAANQSQQLDHSILHGHHQPQFPIFRPLDQIS